ncbi:DASH complex subunit dad2 [Recurvomyces mirabilis]|uniref:DASH complex subunit DAD2 n=1 Tax=Recurvomyces mirabilis TaxID=574656 RepID=A0AAE0WLF4_9PEZI|nr:DASH complex subunit dad2 [Recurvomyces mirabilis]KAK5152300.1 DASH complex subunit dad2 [Recurvomyces mirabilis]
MAYSHRQTTLPSHIRPSSGFANNASASTQSSALQARINEKRVELENLKQLRDLSGGLAGQMQQLEEKLATLSNGTEAVAAVLGNWNNVLRAIHMASTKIPRPKENDDAEAPAAEEEIPLPQTLVRIPIQQAEAMQKEAEAALEAGE